MHDIMRGDRRCSSWEYKAYHLWSLLKASCAAAGDYYHFDMSTWAFEKVGMLKDMPGSQPHGDRVEVQPVPVPFNKQDSCDQCMPSPPVAVSLTPSPGAQWGYPSSTLAQFMKLSSSTAQWTD